jgi:hypothetical protein
MSYVKAKTSAVVARQVPEFVREDHGTFVKFLEAYYEFLEQHESRNLESTRDIDDTVDDFIEYFRNEIMRAIPKDALADERLLAKNIKELYRSKGNVRSFELLFRILFNEPIDLYIPKVDMLRVSDGKWDSNFKLRVSDLQGNTFALIGQTITQPDGASAAVEDVIKVRLGSQTVTELTLNEKSIRGEFTVGSVISGLDNSDETETVTASIISLLTNISITESGLYYDLGETINVGTNSGQYAQGQIQSVSVGEVTNVYVLDGGSGYEIGDEVYFENIDVDNIDIIEPALAVVTDLRLDSFLLEDGSGNLLYEDKGLIYKNGTRRGAIKKVTVTRSGSNYKKLPLVYSPTDGFPAKLISTGLGIGKITSVSVIDPGINYDVVPTQNYKTHLILNDLNGLLLVNEIIQSTPQTIALETEYTDELLQESGDGFLLETQQQAQGTLSEIDFSRSLYSLSNSTSTYAFLLEDGSGNIVSEYYDKIITEDSGSFTRNMTIRGVTSGATAMIVSENGVGKAQSRGTVGAIYKTPGKLINADGKIGDSSKKIQDNRFYQDYSYVIRSTQSMDKYRNIVKKLLHPIGMALFGSVTHQGFVSYIDYLNIGQAAPRTVYSTLLPIIQALINGKMRGFGNYQTGRESHPQLRKEYITLIITDFLATVLNIRILNPESLPILHLPRPTMEEIFLMDLRTEAMHGDEWLYLLLLLQPGMDIHRQTTLITNSVSNNIPETKYPEKVLNTARGLGPCWDSLEKFKFTLPPYAAGSKGYMGYTGEWVSYIPGNPIPPDITEDHYRYPLDEFGNTQNYHYANVVIGEVINNPYKRINFAVDSFVDAISLPPVIAYDSTFYTYDSTIYTNDIN